MTAAEPAVRPQVKIGGSYVLTNHHGQKVTEQSFTGRFALLFFGFTHCKRVCPDTLAMISAALDSIGPLAAKVQPLYLSVDPDRDTPDVMRAFLEHDYPAILGLTGSSDEVGAVKRAFRIYAERELSGSDGDYDVPHTALIFLVGPDGNYVRHFGEGTTADELAQGLREHLERSS